MHLAEEEDVFFDDTCIDDFDDDYTEADHDIINLMKKMDEQATECITKFFDKKEWHCGGEIPEHELISQERIDVLEQLDLEDAVTFFYEYITAALARKPELLLLGNSLRENPEYDTIVVRNVLYECARIKIPKNRAGGLLLIYLDVIAGISIDWEILAEKTKQLRVIKNQKCPSPEET